MKTKIRMFIPSPLRSILSYIFYLPVDTAEQLLGQRDSLTPPTRLMTFDGSRSSTEYKKNGEKFLQYFIDLCDLKPNETILDVGCAIGRKAVPLTRYLDNRGKYEGFDIVKVGINWCKKHISTKYPNFRFQLADVFNKAYNPEGRYKASEYKFPFEDETFDFVFLASVFTHMLPEDMKNYLSETSRVLKKGGRCFITFFLLNPESLALVDTKKSTLDFKYKVGEYFTIDINLPEEAVGYNETLILELFEKYRLKINQSIRYGSWCGRSDFFSYQDIIIANKI